MSISKKMVFLFGLLFIVAAVSGVLLLKNKKTLESNNLLLEEINKPQLALAPTETESTPPVLVDSALSPDRLYRYNVYRDVFADYGDYYKLYIMRLTDKKTVLAYHGNFRTGGWKWTKDNNIEVAYNCGTGCHATKIIKINRVFFSVNFKPVFPGDDNGWFARYYWGKISPNEKYEGFSDEGQPTEPRNYFTLRITDRAAGQVIKKYQRDGLAYHWEWTPENDIKIWRYCGEKCKTFEIIRL